MLLTISTTYSPATDLGFLLHKHPDKIQKFDINRGEAFVFYPEAKDERATVALLLNINPLELARTVKGNLSYDYVNDRPYVSSSFMSHAIARVFSSALNGNCKHRPELVATKMPFEVMLSVIKVRGGGPILEKIFSPLGYEIKYEQYALDEKFPEWEKSNYFTVWLKKESTLEELLAHLYVLIPVFDADKHYWVDKQEVEKLLSKGEGWLGKHPQKEWITSRYLKNLSALTRQALARLKEEEGEEPKEDAEDEAETEEKQIKKEKKISLHQQRLQAAVGQLIESGAKKILDLGCGEGKLIKLLLREKQFQKILGVDVSFKSLLIAKENLYLDEMTPKKRERVELLQGSLTYKDKRLLGYEAATIIEVIEHLEPDRLQTFEKIVFDFIKPLTVVLTTPNAEYNIKYEFLDAHSFRHSDHRFEWTRKEFSGWCQQIKETYSYSYDIFPIGETDEKVGASSQMVVFKLIN